MPKPWMVIALPMMAEDDEGWRKKGELLCPERYSAADLEDLKNGDPDIWNTHYQLHPTIGGGYWFKREDLRFYDTIDVKKLNPYILCDPALSKTNTSDYTTMFVFGAGPDQNIYWLEFLRKRLDPEERCNAIFDLHKRWSRLCGKPVLRFGYEEYGLQADTFMLGKEMQRRSYHFELEPLGREGKWHNLAKAERIRTLIPMSRRHLLYLPDPAAPGRSTEQAGYVDYFIEKEWVLYPGVEYDDALDVVSRVNDPDMDVEYPMPEEDGEDDEDDRASGTSWMSR